MNTATLQWSFTSCVSRFSCNVSVAEGCMNCHSFQLPIVTVSFHFLGSEVYFMYHRHLRLSVHFFHADRSITHDRHSSVRSVPLTYTPSRALIAFNSPLWDPSYLDLVIWRSIYHTTLACWHLMRPHEVPFSVIGCLIGYSPSWHLYIGIFGC